MLSEKIYREIMMKGPLGLCIFDSDFTILEVNEKFLLVLEYSGEDIIGKKIDILFKHKTHADKLKLSLKEKRFFSELQLDLVDKHNSDFHVYLSGEMREIEGTEFGYIRLTTLEESKQIQNKAFIEQGMNLLSILAKGVSHDFNNLLMGIGGYVNLIKMDSKNLSAQQNKFLEQTQELLFKANGLVMQFQYLAKDESGLKIKLDMYSAIKNVFSFLDRTSNKVIHKTINFPADTYYVLADPVEINQIILNLATNSIKAIEKKGAREGDLIMVEAEPAEEADQIDDQPTLHIRFTDTGTGMDEIVKSRVFEPFFTTDRSTDKYIVGLGLPITYEIITRKYKGRIEVDSEPGQGSTFHIYLPLMEPPMKKIETDVSYDSKSANIMIVDDEISIRTVLQAYLKRVGYNVVLAKDGLECIETYDEMKDKIDLIVLDLTMPRLDGVEVFQKLRSINPQQKIIISSGHTEEEITKEPLNQANGHLMKPYNRNTFIEMIVKVLAS